jgi:hypothetical protein
MKAKEATQLILKINGVYVDGKLIPLLQPRMDTINVDVFAADGRARRLFKGREKGKITIECEFEEYNYPGSWNMNIYHRNSERHPFRVSKWIKKHIIK